MISPRRSQACCALSGASSSQLLYLHTHFSQPLVLHPGTQCLLLQLCEAAG